MKFAGSVHNGQATVLVHLYVDDTTLYQVIAVAAGEATFDDPQFAAFFESVHFTADK